jgi:hypothetical protein
MVPEPKLAQKKHKHHKKSKSSKKHKKDHEMVQTEGKVKIPEEEIQKF